MAVAAHRQTRTFLPPTDACPLCPSTPAFASEIPAPDYDVVVFENQFPSFSDRIKPDEIPRVTDPRPVRPGVRPLRGGLLHQRPQQRVRLAAGVAGADGARRARRPDHRDESALPVVAQVFPFENRGVEIGVTLHHPHGQIYAYPTVPPRTQAMLGAAARNRGRDRRAQPLRGRAGRRAASRGAHRRVQRALDGVRAGRVPLALRGAARPAPQGGRHPGADRRDERDAFGPIYLDVLRRCDGLFGKPMPYISAWHQAVVGEGRELGYLHLQLFSIRRAADKLKYLAGSESAMGAFVNDIVPERAAQMLREVGSFRVMSGFAWSNMFVSPEEDPRTDGGFVGERNTLLGYLATSGSRWS